MWRSPDQDDLILSTITRRELLIDVLLTAQDAASYSAGVQAALLRAFQEALPGQQALGSLGAAVQRLQAQLDEERLHARCAETGLAEVSTRLQVRVCPFLFDFCLSSVVMSALHGAAIHGGLYGASVGAVSK